MAYLTVPETAKGLAVKPGTVRKWIYEGRLPYVKLGRVVRVSTEAVAEFIKKNTVQRATR